MTHESHELSLALINENTKDFQYKSRVNLARENAHPSVWASMVAKYAGFYTKQWDKEFTASQILLAAADVAEYYENHVKEMEESK